MTGNQFSARRLTASGNFNAAFLLLASASLLVAGCQQDRTQQVASVQVATETPLSFSEFQDAAIQAMGAGELTRIEYTANGWEACLGQPWNINEGWARWSITDYRRVIDYSTFNSLQTAQRQAAMDPDMLGGCGAQPGAAAQNQQTSVNADSSWGQQLQVYMTPLGFLQLAEQYGGELDNVDNGQQLVLNDVNVNDIHYRVVGDYGDDFLLDQITTWVDDTVYGDMAFEVEFSGYRDFGRLSFPSRIVQKQGGYATLELTIDNVIPNTESSAEPAPREGGRFGGGQQPDLPAYEEIGDGIYALHGAYQSVVMEFDEFSVVLDGLQNDARVEEIIRLTKEIIPDKPIGYVLSTHNHFDHASGLRQFVAEGATILTHEINADFFENALAAPRTLSAEYTDAAELPVNVQGVPDFYAIDDGSQRVEFHKLGSGLHADDMLIAYIPSIKTIVEADLLQPWINPVFGGGDHPFLIYLADELDSLGLDYEQFVPVHRPPNPPLMSRDDLLSAVGRN